MDACLHPTALRGGTSRTQDPPPHRPGRDGGLCGAHDHCADATGEWQALRGRVGWEEGGLARCPSPRWLGGGGLGGEEERLVLVEAMAERFPPPTSLSRS